MELLEGLTFAGVIAFLTTTIAILVKIIGLPDQVRMNYIRKSTEGISTPFFVLVFVSYLLWTIHGLLQEDFVLIVGQGLGVLTSSIILWQIIIYRENDRA